MGRFDPVDFILIAVAVGLAIYAMRRAQEQHERDEEFIDEWHELGPAYVSQLRETFVGWWWDPIAEAFVRWTTPDPTRVIYFDPTWLGDSPGSGLEDPRPSLR